MEEKKQTNRLSYTTSGKRFRGFLCMLTFCAFVISATFFVYGVNMYGTEIITDPKESYMKSDAYQADLSAKVTNVLYNLQLLYLSSDDNKVSFLDMSSNTVHYYDALAMLEEYLERDDESENEILADIESYKRYTVHLETDFTDYEQAVKYLEKNLEKDQYLYFDKETFKELFMENGYKNTNKRISDAFSTDSYFVFYQPDAALELKLQWLSDSENTEKLEELDLEAVEYAVYDAVEDVFYSTWDEYFSPMDYYLYDISEVASCMGIYSEGEIGESKEGINSIVIPLLWSQNLNDGEFWSRMTGKHNWAMNAELSLNNENGAFVYSIKNVQFERSNVTDLSKINNLEYAYKMVGRFSGKVDDGENWKSVSNFELIREAFQQFPDETVFYFGVDPSKAENSTDDISKKYRWYSTFAKGIRYSVAGTVIFLVLLVIQAVWLICTTGRKEKKGKEIALNRFDKIPTEIWCILLLVMMLVFGYATLVSAENAITLYFSNNLGETLAIAVVGALPFGFFFMILTLSFVRRWRAHNIWSESLLKKMADKLRNGRKKTGVKETEQVESKNVIVRTIQRGTKACRESFRNLKGTYKLLIVFTIYMILCGLCFYVATFTYQFSAIDANILFFVYVVLQIIAVRVVLYIVKDTNRLIEGVKEITKGNLDGKVTVNEKTSLYKELSDGINHIGDGLKMAVETSLKDERMKTELITNVSHDLKTPLTSIINYINLLKTEKMPTPEAEHYIEVLDTKAQRLRHLTEDLVEAAKATSGNIELEMMPLTFDELMKQALGEFEDKFEKKNLTVVASYPECPAVVMADGRRMFRIIENILQNVYKYALEGTRIYADLSNNQSVVTFVLKNVSAAPLNISPEELMERFTRGDASRTTEGSGLGLSIAKDLTRLQGGTFDITLDGDLFKVIITFPEYIKTDTV